MGESKIILDSLASNGARLTTMEISFPRYILPEFLVHRKFSKNGASSRAIPSHKKITRIMEDPAEPAEWGKNKAGMSASELISQEDTEKARNIWHKARMQCIEAARELDKLKVHKQITNRVIEPWDTMTMVVSATDWNNFFVLRRHKDADPTFQKLANAMFDAYSTSTPKTLNDDEWHTPYILPEEYLELDIETRKRVSCGRVARVSYLNHDGKRNIDDDLKLFDRLTSRDNPAEEPGHWSPIEHVARPIPNISFIDKSSKFWQAERPCDLCGGSFNKRMAISLFNPVTYSTRYLCGKCSMGHATSGNFRGWHQFRKDFEYENFDNI